MQSIFHRTSIRKYQDRPVEKEKIEQILRAAMAAPSAHNQQPWEFYVVTNKEKIVELSQATKYTKFAKDAPLVFVPCYREKLITEEYAHIDMSAAVENLLLAVDSLGLGATWCGIAPGVERMEIVRKILDIPSHLNAFAVIPCGYPLEEKKQQDRYEECRVHYVE
ncbi:MAG: nitroreductase family protein [Erysipelotrichaceae bacterium]|nr:nitroreductase family protein [Erysipelotrichaceae bacterium]